MRRRGSITLAACVVALAAPGGNALASATIRLVIAHVVAHCHIWKRSTRSLGPSTKLVVHSGTRVVIRSDCPMDFDFKQTKGTPLQLGSTRTYAGTTRTILFRHPGIYRLIATNVQTPEERGLITLGNTNTLELTVVVTR